MVNGPLHVRRLALIGCGLMGGSFALALRQAATVDQVAGSSRSLASVRRAAELGVVDQVCADAQEAVAGADVVLLAVPVTATEDTLRSLLPALSPSALVMDVGSTKRDVVAAARRAMGARVGQFVAAHPIAGKEHGGIEQADALLYQDRRCVLTPLAENAPEAVVRAQTLWSAVGCTVVQMSPEAHDHTFAAVSHLPHLLAFAYVQAIAAQEHAADHLAAAGPGFRDFTRIACSTSAIWRDIFDANRDEVLLQLSAFERSLGEFRSALLTPDTDELARRIDAASAVRTAWQLNPGPAPCSPSPSSTCPP